MHKAIFRNLVKMCCSVNKSYFSQFILILIIFFIGLSLVQACVNKGESAVSTAPVGKGEDELRKWFIKESSKAWGLMSDHYKVCSGNYLEENKYLKSIDGRRKDVKRIQHRFVFCNDFTREIVITSGNKDAGVETVKAQNDKYAFGITKDSSANRSALVWLEQIGKSKEIDAKIARHNKSLRAVVFAFNCIFGTPFNQWINKPGFEINQVSLVGDNKELVQVKFTYTPDQSEVIIKEMKEAYIIFDPALSWTIQEYSFLYDGGATYEGHLEYAQSDSAFPILTNKITLITGFNGQHVYQKIDSFDSIKCQAEVPEKEFYLSHYGLPEPNFDEPFLSTWMKYLLAGLVCLGIAYWIKRRRAVA